MTRFLLLSCFALAVPALAKGPAASTAVPVSATFQAVPLAGYQTLWAVSDLHGHLDRLKELLQKAQLGVVAADGSVAWNPQAKHQLLVATGDYLDGGPESAGVVLAFKALQLSAAKAGSKVVVLLGNHEVEFLNDPDKAISKEFLKSADAFAARLKLPKHPGAKDLYQSELGAYLRGLPAGAVVGKWLFAHSGYLDASNDLKSLQALFTDTDRKMNGRDHKAYKPLMDDKSITAFHHWWKDKDKLDKMQARLATLGLTGLVFGHDPEALGANGTIAMEHHGWLTKIDTGLKDGESKGMLLKCAVADINAHGMANGGKPVCKAFDHDGTLRDIPVK